MNMQKIEECYFKNDTEFHVGCMKTMTKAKGDYLILYKIEHENDSMRWEEAVRAAIPSIKSCH